MSSLTRASNTNEVAAERGAGQWALVWRQFKRDPLAVLGLWLIGFLFAVAIAAPLIANGRPLLLRRGGQFEYPMLAGLFEPAVGQEIVLDRIYNWALCVGLLALALFLPAWLALRWAGAKAPRWAWWGAWAALGLALAVPFARHTSRLDRVDYRAVAEELRESGEGWAVFALVPFGPIEQPRRPGPLAPPSRRHWMGTDNVGRDVFARIVHGARVSLSVGFVAVAISVAIGTVVGALAGYFGKRVDFVISRAIEIVMCFPTFLLILTIVAFLERRSIFNIMLVIGLTSWTGVARLIRGEVLRQRQMDYVSAARALGARDSRVIFRHVLPNSIAPALVAATFGVAGAILTETGLSFLGLGVQIPTPSWGQLLNQARAGVAEYWWLTLWPGLMIFFTVTIYNLAGEGLRDALDPRLRK